MEILKVLAEWCVGFLEDWGEMSLAAVSLLIAIISLIKSSKAEKLQLKISELELKIKQYEFDEVTKEQEKSTMSCVEARVVSIGQGKHRLKVWNSGNVTAYDVVAKFEGDTGIIIMDQDKQPFEVLEAKKNYELVLVTHMGSARKFRILTEWKDSSGNVHSKIQMGDI